MREHFAIDPLIGKKQQLLLATQLCRMVLKVSRPTSLLLFALETQLTRTETDQQCHHCGRRGPGILDFFCIQVFLFRWLKVTQTLALQSCGIDDTTYSSCR